MKYLRKIIGKKRLPKVNTNLEIKRGYLYYADLSPVVGSEQGGIRPVLIIQNDIGNKFSPTVIVAAITAQIQKAKLPTHVEINSKEYNLEKNSVILLEQIRTLDKQRLTDKITILDSDMMKKIDHALEVSLGLSFNKMYDLHSLLRFKKRSVLFIVKGTFILEKELKVYAELLQRYIVTL